MHAIYSLLKLFKFQCSSHIYIYIIHYSSITALYKGLVPKVLRLGPGGAIMLVVYDYMHVFLTKKFKD